MGTRRVVKGRRKQSSTEKRASESEKWHRPPVDSEKETEASLGEDESVSKEERNYPLLRLARSTTLDGREDEPGGREAGGFRGEQRIRRRQ